MDVEQTTQLIQLILNSALMVVACALLLSGLLVRHTAADSRLQTMNREYSEFLESDRAFRGERQIQLKKQLRQLHQRYKASRNSILAIHYALLLFGASTLVLALRTVISASWLIPGSLVLFVSGLGMLLMSVALTLIDLHTSDHSFWQELKIMLNLGRSNSEPKPSLQQHPKFTQKSPQSTAKPSQAKARVG